MIRESPALAIIRTGSCEGKCRFQQNSVTGRQIATRRPPGVSGRCLWPVIRHSAQQHKARSSPSMANTSRSWGDSPQISGCPSLCRGGCTTRNRRPMIWLQRQSTLRKSSRSRRVRFASEASITRSAVTHTVSDAGHCVTRRPRPGAQEHRAGGGGIVVGNR